MTEGEEPGGNVWARIRRLRRPDEFLALTGVALTGLLWLVLSGLLSYNASISLATSVVTVLVLGVFVWRRYDPMVVSRQRKNAFRESRLRIIEDEREHATAPPPSV